jgi:hypothetical protein
MAQPTYTPIQLYYSTTASAAPTAANLAQGELAINITDGKLYYEDNSGTVQVIATKGAGTIGGSTTQIQYNNAGALAGNAAMVFNNSTNVITLTTLNLTNPLGTIYGGTGLTSYTTGDLLYSSASNTLAKLAIGTANYILTVNSGGTNVQWSAPSSISVSTATNLAGGVAGSVPYQSGASTTTFLGIGAADRVMTSSGSAPQWVTALTSLTGVSSSSITNTSLTSGRVVYSGTGGLQTNSANLTFDGTTLTTTGVSNTGTSTIVKLLTVGNTSFNGSSIFAAATPAKLYMGTGTVTDVTSALNATNTTGAIASLAITPIAASNTGVTYTNASTLYIAGAPSAGTNISITNPYALYVAAGTSYFDGSVGIGNTSPASYNSAADNLVIGTSGNNGMTIVSGSTSSGYIMFADGTTGQQAYEGQITYDHTSNFMAFNTSAIERMRISSTGLTVTLGATIQGLTVGLGAGAVSTNTAVGASALSGGSLSGARNIGIGQNAGNTISTGAQNTFVGSYCGTGITTGTQNIGIGDGAMTGNSSNATGSYNIGVGALTALTSGSNNVGVGYQALNANTVSASNTVLGYQAGYTNINGNGNVFVGYQAGYLSNYPTNGQIANTFIGYQSGVSVTTGYKNVIIGSYSGLGAPISATGNNYIVLSDGDGTIGLSTTFNSSIALNGAVPQAGTGITFPASQNASANANTLDDYEEGTWTPEFTAVTAPTGVTYGTQVGRYTKIGKSVTVWGVIGLGSKGTGGSGEIRITGLPFVSENVTGLFGRGAGDIGSATWGASKTQIQFATVPNASYLAIVESGSGQSLSNPTWANQNNNSEYAFSITYPTST